MLPRNVSSRRAELRVPACGLAAMVGAVGVLAGAGSASAVDNGGATYIPTPKIKRVTCVKRCAAKKRLRAGSKVKIRGSRLASVKRIVFHGGEGTEDDVYVKVRPRSSRGMRLSVPMAAQSGPISAWSREDVQSRHTRTIVVYPPPPPEWRPELTPVPGPREPGAPKIETGTSGVTAYYGSESAMTFSYRVKDDAPVKVQIGLIRARDGSVVKSWTPPAAQSGVVNSVTWDGLAAGKPPGEGRYAFRLEASDSGGRVARSAKSSDVQRDAFDFYGHIFPVRGKHDFGGSGARFGSGRSGHSHQGHDVFASCGKRLVTARGGVVKFKRYHSSAGYYMVIDGARTGVDYAYMHLQKPSPFNEGDRVYTGQQIGNVGETGNAQGCHLHFEMWSAPGWYDGGKPFDPLPSLQAWDAVS